MEKDGIRVDQAKNMVSRARSPRAETHRGFGEGRSEFAFIHFILKPATSKGSKIGGGYCGGMGSEGEEVADISDDPELEKGRQSGSNCSGILVSNVLTGLRQSHGIVLFPRYQI